MRSPRPCGPARRSRATSNGFYGENDGWTDLKDDHRLDTRHDSAGPGNVVQTGRVGGVTGRPGHRSATLTLGFGPTAGAAQSTARDAAVTSFRSTSSRYDRGWHRYVGSLKKVPASAASVRRQYLASTLVLAAAEDKLHPGAIVASPSAPWVWGDEVDGLSSPSGAYHLVWSRDAYQFGTALWAQGDKARARRVVDWLFRVQQKPDGSFPQNSDVAGHPVWSELQLDEVALPIVLAHLVGRDDATTYAGVKKAANFLAEFVDAKSGLAAPYSPQERWENQSGYSPNSIAAQISGLVCAADLARRNGDDASAERWLALADAWQAKVQDWTVTTTGPLSDRPYFLRLTKDGNPDAGTTYGIGDGGPSAVDQRRVVDQSFLDLVRYGITAPDDPAVRNTLARGRRGAEGQHAERPVLAPVQLRRVRRDARRRTVDDHRAGHRHHPRPGLAAADRGARRVRRDRRRQRAPVPPDDGPVGRTVRPGRRAGVGRPTADRPPVLPRR